MAIEIQAYPTLVSVKGTKDLMFIHEVGEGVVKFSTPGNLYQVLSVEDFSAKFTLTKVTDKLFDTLGSGASEPEVSVGPVEAPEIDPAAV